MEKMINYEEFDERVERFLRRQMTSEEEQSLKSELASDPEKKDRARVMALMIKTMQQEGQKQDLAIIDDIRGMDEAQFRKAAGLKPKVRIIPLWIKCAAAACVVGIVAFGGFRYSEYNQTTLLGKNQYFAYVPDISEIGQNRGAMNETIIEELLALFANVEEGKEIKRTIESLKTIYEESFNENSEYNFFQDDIAWNLSIAYLKSGNRKKAIPLLEGMIERNADYPQITRPAQRLIDEIKGL